MKDSNFDQDLQETKNYLDNHKEISRLKTIIITRGSEGVALVQ